MLGWILLIAGIAGFGYASYLDLRYTEFPDYVPYSLIIFSLITRGVYSLYTKNLNYFFNSLTVGVMFLSFGLLLYHAKQWGDGDAWLMGALGFLFPDSAGFSVNSRFYFPFMLLFNFLFVSLVYLVAYSIVLGLKQRSVYRLFINRLKNKKRKIVTLSMVFLAFSWGSGAYLMLFFQLSILGVLPLLVLPLLFVAILIFSEYARVIEKNLFKKKISVKDLKVGDVLADDKWKGLTENDLKRIRKIKKYVWVKEGVRFAPVFLITLLITMLFGGILPILI
ncbi:MAG: prepilin peptidase [Candidatus Aenigmarchaeota archaeon]|nr:prepilin peptidase [Candidatus Aenigmarchaeota archaeon]